MSRAIVVLGKEPLAGSVKTRLAQSIGNEKAAEVQGILARYLFKRLIEFARTETQDSSQSCDIVFQLKGSIEGSFAQWCKTIGVVVENQVVGTLTEKIHHASKRGAHTLVLGMDMPLIEFEELRQAFECNDVVLGPAEDGGYWLIGGPKIPKSILEGIPWSTPDVWKKTIAKCITMGIQYKVLSRQQDIDTLSDLQTLLSNPACPPPLAHELRLVLEGGSLSH